MAERIEGKCPQCGGALVCTREEMGGWDEYIGLYRHECSVCKHVAAESELRREGVVCVYDDEMRCPICNRHVVAPG